MQGIRRVNAFIVAYYLPPIRPQTPRDEPLATYIDYGVYFRCDLVFLHRFTISRLPRLFYVLSSSRDVFGLEVKQGKLVGFC